MYKLSDIKDFLKYCPQTGYFTWLKRPFKGKCNPGDRAGTNSGHGYRRIGFKGQTFYEHHLAWWFVNNKWPTKEIDHINLNKSDNRIENLRLVDRAQNGYNKPNQRNNTSGYKGVSFNKKAQKWEAYITFDGQRKHLGLFNKKQTAKLAYEKMALKHHGEEFVRL